MAGAGSYLYPTGGHANMHTSKHPINPIRHLAMMSRHMDNLSFLPNQ